MKTIKKPSHKTLDRLLLSFSNVSRTAFISLIGLFINYVLLHYKSTALLSSYVYCITTINLIFVFSNWGGKDFSTKLLVSEPSKLKESINTLLNSRVLLFLPSLLIIFLLPVVGAFKLFIAVYLLLKLFTSVFETLITVQKKFHVFLIIDFCLNIVLLVFISVDQNSANPLILFAELVFIEFLRVIVCFIFFRKYIIFRFNFTGGVSLVKFSRNYFFVALAGFACSKADLYSVGLVVNKEQMSIYFIILNLVGLCLVSYATLVSTFSANIFRYNLSSFEKFSIFSIKAGLLFSLVSAAFAYLICNYYYRITFGFWFTLLVFLNVFLFTMVLTQMYNFTRLEKQTVILKALVVTGIVNILLSLLLAQQFGIIGSFLSNTIGSSITLIYLKTHLLYARN
ncbi:hypothetical protein [Aurantibacillus circumpalustris]|uniref:hypothetical protein n=1 Tax=Aurantibacillus circumpalustris TaxID=3036359 RepID=UPI00295BAFFF|nr:hypothetical protein [Aurantibacillus circumpalustris]